MRAHRIYNENTRNRGANRTLIFNVLRYLTRQAILRAARNDPLSIEDRRIRFSPDFSNFTVKRCQGFHQAMDAARATDLEFFLLYPATLKIKDGAQYKAFTRSGGFSGVCAARRLRRGMTALPRLDHIGCFCGRGLSLFDA